MILLILLALLNGCCISFCRILNGRLGQDTSAFDASLWNHIVGFAFLSFIVYFTPSVPIETLINAPLTTYIGGVIGALFVAINSYVLSRIGATLTALFVIGGQLLAGVVWDAVNYGAEFTQMVGVLCILAGILVTKYSQSKRAKRINST